MPTSLKQMTYTYFIKCHVCSRKWLVHVSYPPSEWYPGHEVEHSYCPKCRKDVTTTVVREATLSDKLIPWMPWEGPPLPRGFFSGWLKPTGWRGYFRRPPERRF